MEEKMTARFLGEDTMGIISQCLDDKEGSALTSQVPTLYL